MSQKKREGVVGRSKIWVDENLQRRGWTAANRRLLFHYVNLTWEQVIAVVPISVIQVLVLAIFFRRSSSTPAIDAAGLISAIVGLVLFLEGLRVAIMPMALLVGTQLPVCLKLPFVLMVAFVLGVLVTYAEPAIAAIRPLAKLVDPKNAPYLYYMMNQQQEVLVLAIGLGVGLASVVGTLKFLSGKSIKPFIAGALLPTLGLSCYMQWGNPHLAPILGVAWDCGGVTTGPVTVPILLSLGVGVMKAQREKQMALAVLEDAAVHQAGGNTLEGFGIVTLASLLPVLAVQLMAIITSAIYPYEYVLEQASQAQEYAANTAPAVADISPVKEVIFGIRAICPLIVALMVLVLGVLKQPLPHAGFVPAEDPDDNSSSSSNSSEDGTSSSKHKASRQRDDSAFEELETVGSLSTGISKSSSSSSMQHGNDTTQDIETAVPVTTAAAATVGGLEMRKQLQQGLRHDHIHVPKVAAAVVLAAGEAESQDYFDASISALEARLTKEHYQGVSSSQGQLSGMDLSPSDTDLTASASAVAATAGDQAVAAGGHLGSQKKRVGLLSWFRSHSSLLVAMVMCQIGMILFNIGLTYGFTALGDMTGSTLPASFLKVPYEPGSPFYSVAGGVTITMLTIFALGFAATNAEPALNVLGQTVETLSNRKFTRNLLVYAVCVGVAVGMCAGASKILFQLPLLYFILAKYFVAGVLTLMSKEAITAVAWDSAGVTTGPVTVPFVMSIGVGFSKAVGAPEGFGMLTVMSVAPIISVLTTSMLRKPVKRAAIELARISKVSLAKISRMSNRFEATSVDRSDTVIDFAAELDKNPNWTPGVGKTAASGLARLSRRDRDIGRPSRPLQTIGEHSPATATATPTTGTMNTTATTQASPSSNDNEAADTNMQS